MKQIAITGASGYIGKHVIDAINKRGHKSIKVIYPRDCLQKSGDFIEVDILNITSDEVVDKFSGIDAVIHLAWTAGFNHHDPSHLQNVNKHLAFIENLMLAGVKNISVAGTMHEIGYYVGEIDSNTACNPINPYGIAKNFLRQACLYLANKYNVNLKWLRMYYILGDDISSNSIFSKILKAEINDQETFPLNSGEMLYDFINVNDLAQQIAMASEQELINGIINCCSGKPVSLRTTVEKFIFENELKIKPEYNVFPSREYDSPAIWGNSKIINELTKNVQ